MSHHEKQIIQGTTPEESRQRQDQQPEDQTDGK